MDAERDTDTPPQDGPASGPRTPEVTWTTDDAKELYLIDRWGSGYFDVTPDGFRVRELFGDNTHAEIEQLLGLTLIDRGA